MAVIRVKRCGACFPALLTACLVAAACAQKAPPPPPSPAPTPLTAALSPEAATREQRVLALRDTEDKALAEPIPYKPSDPFTERRGNRASFSNVDIAAVALKGIAGGRALVDAPCNGCTTLRVGQKLRDGYVKSIGKDRIVFVKRVDNPAQSRTIEIVKTLSGFP